MRRPTRAWIAVLFSLALLVVPAARAESPPATETTAAPPDASTALSDASPAARSVAAFRARGADASGAIPVGKLLAARDAIERLPGGRHGPPLPSAVAAILGGGDAAPARTALSFGAAASARAPIGGPAAAASIGPLVAAPPVIDPWVNIGPGNLGGRTRALAVPQSNVLFAGAAAGGVFRSVDGGASWSATADFIGSLAVSTLAVEPTGVTTLYAGTGESFNAADALPGAGIFKSEDSGNTWNQLAFTNPTLNTFFTLVNKVVVSPGNPTFVYAATSTRFMRSKDSGRTWSSLATGDFREVAVRTPPGQGNNDLVFVFSPTSGLQRSTINGTPLSSPTGLPSGMARATVRFGPDNSVWALFASGAGASGGLFRSTDNGASFARQDIIGATDQGKANAQLLNDAHQSLDLFGGLGIDCATPVDSATDNSGFFAQALGIRPVVVAQPSTQTQVWVGGVDVWRSNNTGLDFGPASYSWLPPGQAAFARADIHAMVFDPGYNGGANQTLYFAGDGGVFKTTNAEGVVVPVSTNDQVLCRTSAPLPTIAFSSLNHGYAATQFNGGGVSTSGNTFFGATQDTGIVKFNPASPQNDWTQQTPGIGHHVAVDIGNPSFIYATGTLAAVPVNGDFFRSTDGGATFNKSVTGILDLGFTANTPFGIDPTVAGRLWIGGKRPHLSTDGGATWTPKYTTSLGLTSTPISAWAIAPSGAGQVVYMGTANGEIWVSFDALSVNPTWTPLVFAQALPRKFISALAVDPTNPKKIYIAFNSYDVTGGQLWMCPDTSAFTINFTPAIGISAQIPNIPINALVIHPAEPRILFVGTDLGVLSSPDGGDSWANIGNGSLANTRVSALQLQGVDKLFAFTHGRGVFTAQVHVPLITVVSPDGGERFVPGTTSNVTWTASAGSTNFSRIDHFDVKFARDGSLFNQSIAAGVPAAARTVAWAVPGLRTTFGKVQVEAFDASNSSLGLDRSDNAFTVNSLPLALPGAPQILLGGANATLDASASNDPDGDPITYRWTQVSPAAPVAAINPTAALTGFTLPAGPPGLTFQFALDVSDPLETASAVTSVRINTVPTASAGPDVRIAPGGLVTLTGSGSADADGQALAYSWSQLAGPDEGFPRTTVNPTFTAPAARGTILDFKLDVSDGLASASDTVRVTVNSVPNVVVGAPQRVAASSTVTLSGSASSDADFDPLIYTWSQLNTPPTVVFNAAAANPTFTAPAAQGTVLGFRLSVSDSVEQATANTTVTVNRKPVPVIVAPTTVQAGAVVTLDGSGSTDGDGDALVYTWSQTAGPLVNFATSTASTTFTAPAVSGGVITMRLAVFDGLEFVFATHTVNVNAAPVPRAGPDRTVAPQASVVLDGASSTDADGDAIRYAWTQLSGTPVTLAGAAGAQASFTAPATRGDVLTFRLTCSDALQSATDDITIRVNRLPVSSPTAPPAVTPGQLVSLTGSASSDPDGDPLTYLWTQTVGPAVGFASTTANTSFTAPATRGVQLAFSLRVSDGAETATVSVPVHVNQLPVARVAAPEIVVAPDAIVTLDASPSSDPDGDPITYSWTQTEGPALDFATTAAQPQFSVSGIDRGTVLSFSVTASDGPEHASAGVRVRVNQAPIAVVPATVTSLPGEPVQVSAGGSTDPDSDLLHFHWRQTSGPAVTFEPTAKTLSFTAPAVGRQSLSFEVEVSDGVETALAATRVTLSDRTYSAGLNGGGAAGGCNQTRHGDASSAGNFAGIWLMTVFLLVRRRRVIAPD